MGDNSPAPEVRAEQSEKWVSLVEMEFRDVYIEIESDDGKVSAEQIQRTKRLEKRKKFRG